MRDLHLTQARLVHWGQVNLHQVGANKPDPVAPEQGVSLGAGRKGTSPSAAKIPFIGEKIPFAVRNGYPGFGLIYNNPVKRNAEGYRVPRTWA